MGPVLKQPLESESLAERRTSVGGPDDSFTCADVHVPITSKRLHGFDEGRLRKPCGLPPPDPGASRKRPGPPKGGNQRRCWADTSGGPTSITLTTALQRFKITGTLAGGQTGLWIVARQFAGNGDNWTSGAIYLWGACLQKGNDPKAGYARTWGYQTSPVAAGAACGPMLVVAKDSSESPFRVAGPGSNLPDHTLLQVTAGGELIIAGSTGNGYPFAELMGATNPSGWSGVIKVKNPAGVTAGYILLYSNP